MTEAVGDIHSRGTITFFIAVAKSLPGSTLRGGNDLFSSQFKGLLSVVGKAQWQEHEAVGPIASAMNVGVQLSPFYSFQDSIPWHGATHIQGQCRPNGI